MERRFALETEHKQTKITKIAAAAAPSRSSFAFGSTTFELGKHGAKFCNIKHQESNSVRKRLRGGFAEQLPEKKEGVLKQLSNVRELLPAHRRLTQVIPFPRDKEVSAWRAPNSGTARSNK